MSDALEERLAALEQTVADVQKTIEDKKHEVDNTQIDRLRESVDSLTAQLSLLTVRRQRAHGRYEPWSEEREALTTHKYVAREVLSNTLWRALRVVKNFFTGWRAVNELLDSMPAHTITRHTRFPPYGLYVNINNLDVYILIQKLKENAYAASVKGNLGGCTSRFEETVAKLQTLAVASVGSGRTVGMLHDRSSFEEEYKLNWVVADQNDEVGEENEGTVTGLTTSV